MANEKNVEALHAILRSLPLSPLADFEMGPWMGQLAEVLATRGVLVPSALPTEHNDEWDGLWMLRRIIEQIAADENDVEGLVTVLTAIAKGEEHPYWIDSPANARRLAENILGDLEQPDESRGTPPEGGP